MKKTLFIITILSMSYGIAQADIRKTAGEKNIHDLIYQVRQTALNSRERFTEAKVKLADYQTVYSASLDATDKTKLSTYQSGLQTAIDHMNVIINKIDTDFPAVQ